MDNTIEYNFNGFSWYELMKGRDALTILYDYGFYEEKPPLLSEIEDELERRTNAEISGIIKNTYGRGA